MGLSAVMHLEARQFPTNSRQVLGLYRKRSGAMSCQDKRDLKRRSVFDRAT